MAKDGRHDSGETSKGKGDGGYAGGDRIGKHEKSAFEKDQTEVEDHRGKGGSR